MEHCPPSAFTLIELLVVITIIVVLLALLTPALDKAIYQAELTVCGTNARGIATGVTLYTADFRRYYPHRPEINGSTRGTYTPSTLNAPEGGIADRGDLRATIRKYLSVNGVMNCPLNGKNDFEAGDPSHTYIRASYDLWFGWQYVGQKGTIKRGDRFEWGGNRFAVLASDLDIINQFGSPPPQSVSGHPDTQGLMSHVSYAQTPNPQVERAALFAETITYSLWYMNPADYKRGPLDNNQAFDDGSVQRHNAITWDESEPTGRGRMSKVPAYNDGTIAWPGTWTHLPRS